MKTKRLGIFFPFFFLCISSIHAQLFPDRIKKFLDNDHSFNNIGLQYSTDVKEVYKILHYQPIWIGNSIRIQELLQQLKQSGNLGLREKDYQSGFIQSFLKDNPEFIVTGDSIAVELRFTDAAIHFFRDLVNGNNVPQLGYNGLNYSPGCLDIPELLAAAVAKDQLPELASVIEQKTPEYISLKKIIAEYNAIVSDSNFREVKISSNKIRNSNKELLLKLYQLSIIESAEKKMPDSILIKKIRSAQQFFNLSVDGKLGRATLAALNVPVQSRLNELRSAINTIRWLFCIKQSEHVIIVNIPSATLLVYNHGKAILESRIIVGKASTPTPTLCSKITEVILYPYWMVPYSIATKELLPSIKKNPGYIDANNYQVLDRQGRIMNPYKINWQSLSRSYFPYVIRQSTGCDNALGLIKLNFYNPYSVYLHDTPGKKLFNSNRRYFSHGCMRVQKAMELGHLVLKNNKIAIDTLEQKGCLRNQAPIVVKADENIPVFVLYNTAWINTDGVVGFFEDIYRKLNSAGKQD